MAPSEQSPQHEHAPRRDWFALIKQPHIQMIGALCLIAVLLLFGGVGRLAGSESKPLYSYQVVATALMLFGVSNALVSLSATRIGRYWSRSFISYMVLGAVGLGLAYLYSGIPLGEAGSYKAIVFTVTFGYLVILSIVNAIRGIVRFAETEEWSQPRKRDRD